jgi:hypothetical protein
MSLPELDIALEIAEPDDIPRMHQIGLDGFAAAGDTHTFMKMAERGTTDLASEMSVNHLRTDLSRPDKATAIKAVDKASGKIVGSVRWGLWHYDGSKPAVSLSCVRRTSYLLDVLSHPRVRRTHGSKILRPACGNLLLTNLLSINWSISQRCTFA